MEGFGALRSPIDDRDWIVESIYETEEVKIPKTLDLRNKIPPVRSQGGRGTCMAFAASAVKEYQERIDCDYKDYMSPEYFYWFRDNKPSAGMNGRDMMKILTTKGSCPEDFFKYNPLTEPTELPSETEDIATQYRIKNYARINTIDGVKTALLTNGPCIITFPVYKHRPEFWRKSSVTEKSVGGHAVTIVGYNEHGFILRNSWGKGWNSNGHVLYSYSEFGSHWDIWTTIDLEGSKPPKKKPGCLSCFKR